MKFADLSDAKLESERQRLVKAQQKIMKTRDDAAAKAKKESGALQKDINAVNDEILSRSAGGQTIQPPSAGR
jgi:hypothetical protein